jgi:AraC-like DNA-binding protein
MRAKGYADAELLHGTGIEPAALGDPDYFIRNADYEVVLGKMIHLAGDTGLGLELGATVEATDYGVLAYTGLSCGTIRQGLHSVWARYGAAFGVNTTLSIIAESGEDAVLEINARSTNAGIYRFQVEEALCSLLRIGGLLSSGAPAFEHIELAYPMPVYSERYAALFGCEVRFAAPNTRVTVRRAWLDQPLKTTDLEFNRVGRAYLDRVLERSRSAHGVSDRLREMLANRLNDAPGLEDAAQHFNISSRTLARQLQAEGWSYRGLVQQVRSEAACDWLRNGRIGAKEASRRLGFHDVAAFRRAFKEWTGQTVSAYCASLPPKPGFLARGRR